MTNWNKLQLVLCSHQAWIFILFCPFDYICYEASQTSHLGNTWPAWATCSSSMSRYMIFFFFNLYFSFLFSQTGMVHTATLWSFILLTLVVVLPSTTTSFHWWGALPKMLWLLIPLFAQVLQPTSKCSNNDPQLASHPQNTANCVLPGILTLISATKCFSPASPEPPH